MKRCTKCKENKSESEFYGSKTSKNGLQPWCKECVKANSRNRKGTPRIWSRTNAESMKLVKEMLIERGIPSCIGMSMEQAKVDLLAWACVPIECKISRECKPDQFIWTFTKGQLSKLSGLLICVADYVDRKRVLVIPAEQIKYSAKEKALRRGSLTVTFESFDVRSLWPALMQYEDRFDLIEEYRLRFSVGNRSPAE